MIIRDKGENFFMSINYLNAIKRIEQRRRELPGAISLAQGIPSLPTHEILRQAAKDAIRQGWADSYSPPAGLLELRQAFQRKLQQENMKYEAESEIIVTVGAMEALSAAILALAHRGEELILFTPAYPAYRYAAELAGLTVREVPLNEDDGWAIDFSRLASAITNKTRLILICSPNNPTGSVLSESDLRKIAEIVEENNVIIIMDDAYEKFYFSQTALLFNLATLTKLHSRLVRVVSFSKTFSMSGWRIGFIHSDKTIINKILAVHDTLVNCAPVISQYAALAAIRHEQELIKPYLLEYGYRRQLMGSLLTELKPRLEFGWPQGAYFFFPRLTGIRGSEKFCFDLLEKEKVAIVPGEDFGQGGQGHVRLCFGRSRADIREGVKRFGHYLNRFFIE